MNWIYYSIGVNCPSLEKQSKCHVLKYSNLLHIYILRDVISNDPMPPVIKDGARLYGVRERDGTARIYAGFAPDSKLTDWQIIDYPKNVDHFEYTDPYLCAEGWINLKRMMKRDFNRHVTLNTNMEKRTVEVRWADFLDAVPKVRIVRKVKISPSGPEEYAASVHERSNTLEFFQPNWSVQHSSVVFIYNKNFFAWRGGFIDLRDKPHFPYYPYFSIIMGEYGLQKIVESEFGRVLRIMTPSGEMQCWKLYADA